MSEPAGEQHIQRLVEIESGLFILTELCKTIKPEELAPLFELITFIESLPVGYIALRLQANEFFIAISHLLPHTQANQEQVQGILKYVLDGFDNEELTLASSAYCFHMLCKENSSYLA